MSSFQSKREIILLKGKCHTKIPTLPTFFTNWKSNFSHKTNTFSNENPGGNFVMAQIGPRPRSGRMFHSLPDPDRGISKRKCKNDKKVFRRQNSGTCALLEDQTLALTPLRLLTYQTWSLMSF